MVRRTPMYSYLCSQVNVRLGVKLLTSRPRECSMNIMGMVLSDMDCSADGPCCISHLPSYFSFFHPPPFFIHKLPSLISMQWRSYNLVNITFQQILQLRISMPLCFVCCMFSLRQVDCELDCAANEAESLLLPINITAPLSLTGLQTADATESYACPESTPQQASKNTKHTL